MQTVESKTSIIKFNPEVGILCVYAKPNSEIEIADARHDFELAANLVNYQKVPVLADSRNVNTHSKEVREYYASKEVGESITAMAVLVDSVATRLVGNFFIMTSKPHFPTRMFTNEETAMAWLKSFAHPKEKTANIEAYH